MIILDRILTVAYAATLAALAGFALWLAARGLQGAYRLIRFRLGPVTAERAPLSPEEARALAEMRRRYRQRAPETVYLDREDRL